MVQDYLFPSSVQETVQLLGSYHGTARLIAGGTDLMLDLNSGNVQTEYLIDISRILDLPRIQLQGKTLAIGAGVTHQEAAGSALIKEKVSLLADACRAVGSPQIRNIGTLVGNVINGQPAADSAVALVALSAQAEILGAGGKKVLPVEQLYAQAGKSVVDSTRELVTGLSMPVLENNQGSSFIRLSRRKALSLPMLNVAVVVSLVEDTFQGARIVMAPVGPKPIRAREAEDFLAGAPVSEASFQRAAELCQMQANPRDSRLRGSREYRKAVLRVLVYRALKTAVNQARSRYHQG